MSYDRDSEALKLPDGKRIAVLLNVAYEGWEDGACPSMSPMGNPLPPGVFDRQAASWAAYGYRRGIWRLLSILSEANVRATFFTSACLTELAPASISAIVSAGHEVAGHGYSQHRFPAQMSPTEEAAEIKRCIGLLETAGQRPSGWLSPRGTPSEHTAEIVASHGMQWFSDVFDDDNPSVLHTDSGELVTIPLKMEVNDLPLYMKHGNEPSSMLRIFVETLDAVISTNMAEPYLDVTVHAHVFGRPYGAWVFGSIIDSVRERDDVWMPTRGELAEWKLSVMRESI